MLQVAPERSTTIDVENPATGEIVGAVPRMTEADVHALAADARAAQRAWWGMGFDGRRRVLVEARRWLSRNRDRVIETISAESGKPRDDATVELTLGAEALAFWAKHAEGYLADERMRGSAPLLLGRTVITRYEPLGVIGIIEPWNAAYSLEMLDATPALAAGNAVILKPSELTPLSAELIQEMYLDSGMPAGVFQLAHGDGEAGGAVVDVSDYVAFTGSERTGRKVMERAAKSLTQVSLELGGKDPMLVLADADLERAASGAVYGAMFNAGQVCMSIERVYVEAPVYEEFVAKVVEQVRELRLGASDKAGKIDIGPIIFPPQIEKIEAHVRDAVAKGARVLTGGQRADRPGRFYEPTVLVDVDHTMDVMTEETFGPVLPIMKVADAEEAVRLANDTPYGLQGSVWTADRERGAQLAARVEAGTCNVNDAMVNLAAFAAPYGGRKSSGIGRRNAGAAGIRRFCTTQVITDNRRPLKREVLWFPYSPWATRMVRGLVGVRGRFTR